MAAIVTTAQGWDSALLNFGSALLALILLVPPSVAVATLIGWGVIALARRLPPKSDERRQRAVLLASGGVFLTGAVAGIALLPFTSSAGLSPLAVLVHGLIFSVLPTTCAIVAWSRYTPPGQRLPR
jgi:hypothetical protein